MVTCCSKARTCPISVRWYRSILPCDCDEYAGDCLTLMLAPRFCATVFKRFRMNSSWSVCSVVGESVACARPHSNMNVCRHVPGIVVVGSCLVQELPLPYLIRHLLLSVLVVLVCLQRLSCM